MTVFESPAALLDAVGAELGTSAWIEIDQERIDGFAAATGDDQWIHVDVERATSGPFGGTIAHGYLTLSLLAPMLFELLKVENAGMSVNYGLDRVRFIQPVRSGSRVRGIAVITSAESGVSGVRVGARVTVEIEGATRPALSADAIVLVVPA